MRTVHAVSVLKEWNDKRSSSMETTETTAKNDSKQNDKRTVLLNKLSEIFVPSLFGSNFFSSGIVDRKSLMGRITVYLSQRDSYQEKKEKIAHVFEDAIKTLKASKETIPLELFPVMAEIDYALNADLHVAPLVQLPENESLEEIKQTFSQKTMAAQQECYNNSILRCIPPTAANSAPRVTNENFLSIFKGKVTSESLNYILSFIQDNTPFFSPEDKYFSKFTLIADGIQFISAATKKFLDNQTTVSDISKESLEKIKKLQPGHRWMLCGAYGQRVESIQTAFEVLKLLPQDAKDYLPHPFPAILSGEKFPEPQEFAEKALHEAITEIQNLFPDIKNVIGFKGIDAFFEDDKRALPNILSYILPSIVDKTHKEGLLKLISAFVPNETASDLIDWIGANRNALLNPNQRELKRRELERKISEEFLKDPCAKLMKGLDAWLFSTVNSLQKNMPAELMEFIGIDSFLASGAMWIEFERLENGKLALLIHASGPAMNKHPLFFGTQIEWPLRINNVDPAKVDENFLQQILFHTLEPLKSSQAVSKAENIYSGPLKHLGGQSSAPPQNTSSNLDLNIVKGVATSLFLDGVTAETLPAGIRLHTELDVALASMVNPAAPLPLVQFHLRLKTFLEYTQQFLTGPQQTLQIKDATVGANLEMAIKALISEANKIEENGQLIIGLNAAADEINEAIENCRKSEEAKNFIETDHALQIPKKILDAIQNLFQSQGLDTQVIAKTKGLLCMFLGEDAEEIIDSLTDALQKHKNVSGTENTVPLSKKGFLKTVIESIYTYVAMSALELAWMFHQFSVGTTPSILLLRWGNWGIQKILPAPLYNWYKTVISSLTMKISKIILYFILRVLFFSGDEMEKLETYSHQLKHIIKVWAKTLNSSQKIEFTFDPKIKSEGDFNLHLNKSPLALNSAKVSFNGIAIQPNTGSGLNFPLVNNKNFDHYIPLINFAESVAIPKAGEKDVWDTIENPELYLDKFSNLATQLYNNIVHFQESPDLVSRSIVAMYSTLAITEKLAKRCNKDISELPVNIYPFLAFVKSHGHTLKTPILQDRVRQICAYFIPNVNLDTLSDDPLSDPAIVSAMEKCLFDYSKAHNFTYILSSNHLPETRYLNSLLSDKNIDTKLAAVGVSVKTPHRMKLGVLLEESLVFTRTEELVPAAFRHLKLHTLLANRMVTHLGSIADKSQFKAANVKTAAPQNYDFNFDEKAFYQRALSNMKSLLDKPTDHPLICNLLPSKNNYFFTAPAAWNTFIRGVLTQSEIIAAEKGRIDVSTTNSALAIEISKGLENVFVERDDIILRALDFLDKYLHQLTDNNDVLMKIFDSAFLGFGNLEKQLQASPQVAAAIIAFLNQKIPALIANKQQHHALWLIKLGMHLKPFIHKSAPQFCKDFPDFNRNIDQIIQEEQAEFAPSNCYSQVLGYALQLKALTYPKDPNHLDNEEQRQLAGLAITRAFFFHAENGSEAKEYQLTPEFRELYRFWLPTITKMCKDNPPYTSSLSTHLLRDRHLSMSAFASQSQITWQSDYQFTIQHSGVPFSINLQTAYLDGPITTCLGTYFRVREKVMEICPSERYLVLKADGTFSTTKGYTVTFSPENDEITIDRKIDVNALMSEKKSRTSRDLRKFIYISTPEISKHLLPFVQGDAAELGKAKFWIEDTREAIKKIYVEFENTPPLLLETKSTSEGNAILEICHILEIHHKRKEYKIVPNKQFAHILFPLTRFCPNNKMFCFTSKLKNQLSKIFLEPFNLTFNIVEQNGQELAESVQQPGFHLAAQQIHPSLHGMPSYLLLKNNNNDARVLIPEGQWISSYATTIIPKVGVHGSLARVLERWFGSIQQTKSTETQKIYSFDINKNGLLVSEDPESMMYLICLYLLQNKGELAEKTCLEMLRVIKLKKEKIDLSRLLFMFSLVPSHNTNISRMRRRIVAAIEENNAMYAGLEKPTQAGQERQLKNINVISQSMVHLNACKEDLEANFNEKEKRFKLTDDEELRLFNRFNTLAEDLIRNGCGLPPSLLGVIDQMGWNATSSVFMLPSHLSSRYEKLTNKLDKTKTRSLKAKGLLTEYVRTSSSYSSVNVVEVPNTLGLIGKLASAGVSLAKGLYTEHTIGIRGLDVPSLAAQMQAPQNNPPLDKVDEFIANVIPLFASYYAIAFGYGTTEQSEKLTEMLQLAKGGRCGQTGKLIEFLSYINKTTFVADIPQLLNEILAQTNTTLKTQKLNEFLNNLNSQSINYNNTASLFSSLGTISLDKVYGSFLSALSGVTTYNTLFNLGAHGVSKAYNMAKNAVEDKTPLVQPYMDPSYAGLNNIDAFVDGALSSIFDIGFVEVDDSNVQLQIEDFKDAEEINLSLKKFYERKGDSNKKIECKGITALCNMQLALGSFHGMLQDKCEKDIKNLLEIINARRPQDKYTLQSLKKALLHDQWAKIGIELGFTQEEMAQIEKAVVAYLAMATRAAQIGRILENFKKLSYTDLKNNPMEFIETLEAISVEIKAKRAYNFAEVPKRLALRYMIFEFYTNTMIWDVQADPLTEMLKTKEGNIFLVMLMSLGKTFQMIPVNDSELADGENIVFNVFTDGLKETNARQVSQQGHTIFDQSANNMPVSRQTMRNIKQQEAVNLMLARAQSNREIVNIVPSEAQSLDANLMDLVYYAKRSGKNDLTLFLSQVHHKMALMTLRTKGVAIQDEAHIQYDPKEGELNHPIGEEKSIEESYQNVMEECMRQLVMNSEILDKIRSNSLEDLTKTEYLTTIAKEAAQRLTTNPLFKLHDDTEKKAFVEYVTAESKEIPAILRNKSSYEQICMAKGVLSILVPYLMDLNIYVDYAIVGKSASPHSGNMNPHAGYDIQIPYEKAIKTYVSYLNKGLSEKEADDLRIKLFKGARKEMQSRSRTFKKTHFYNKLTIILKDDPELLAKISEKNTPLIESQITAALQNNPEAIFQFIRLFGYREMKYWPRCNRINNQNFPSLWKRVILDTGTPYNIKSCPDNLKVIEDPATTGEAAHIISTNCIDDTLILDAKTPAGILENALAMSFMTSEFSMLTDGNAVLKGLSNTFVADVMDEHCASNRPDIKAIVYFTTLEGKDQLVYREIGSKTPKPFDQCKLKPKEYLTYIDENHDFGTNVEQYRSQLILYKKQPLFRVFQQAFRTRDIKVVFKLLMSGEFEELAKFCTNKKQIRFAMTHETAQRLSPADSKPNLRTILEDARQSQKDMILKSYYISYRKKLHNVIREAIKDKGIFAKSALLEWSTIANDINRMNEIFADFEDFLIPIVEDKPSALFGKIEEEMATKLVIELAKKELYAVIAKSKHFSTTEKIKIQEALDGVLVPPMPAKVLVYKDGNNIDINTQDILGAQTMVQAVLENEMDIDQAQQANTAVKTIAKVPSQFVEAEWPKNFDYSTFKWLNFRPGKALGNVEKLVNKGWSFLSKFKKAEIQFPSIFQLSDGLSNAANPAVKFLSGFVNDKLWFTNNYIPRIMNSFFGEPVDVGSQYQRDLFQVLVIVKDGQISSVGCLSQHEATFWKEESIKLSSAMKDKNMRMFVYDIPSRTIRGGGSDIDQYLLHTNKEFLQMEVELKFINGDDTYTPEQARLLKEWLSDKDIDAMEKAFYAIHAQRKNDSAAKSDIENIFLDLREVPLLAR
ncbi:MAG: DUF3638 domain-containing protein [Parachlamydiales bacterium]|jgi:hypothetical protein